MSGHADAAKIVQGFWEAFGNHDVEAAAAFVDPDVVRRGPIPDPEEKDNCRGKDNYVTFEGSYHGLFDAAMWTADMAGMTDPAKGDPAQDEARRRRQKIQRQLGQAGPPQ